MAEFLTFAAQELLKKVASVATQEFTLVWGLQAELANLRESLLFLEAVLRDAEQKQQDQGEAVKLWLAKLENIAHLADDVLDDYGYELLRRKVELRNQMKKKVLNFFSLSNPTVFRVKLAHKIKNINRSLEDLGKKAIGFGFVERPYLEAPSSYDRRIDRETYSDFKIDENIVIGRQGVVEDIIKVLANTNNNKRNDLSVLSIVGMGGLGKTTLAKSVYHDKRIEQHFQQKIWVCVSTPFEVSSILRGILESLKPEQAAVQTKEAMCKILKVELKEKRYLLVLDDVWNENAQNWEELKGCLVNISDGQGSSILVTTRSDKVAKMVETLPRCDLEKLSDGECWLIIKDKAISVGSSITEDQEKIGKEIAKKCRGVPLVAKVLGSMMCSKNCDEWQSIVESGIWNLPEEENRILAVLKLSFDELRSPSLKQCFAYCSKFIKDFLFEKEDLIQHWMAQGWLHPSPNQNDREMEDIGNEYFHILLQNSFFQDVIRYGGVIRCKMHDLVHDIAERVTRSKYLRSLFSDGLALGNSPGFKALRVLNLYKADIEELPCSIGKLKHLRYLNVMETKIKVFPKSLGQLYNLQTFKMPYDIAEFPKQLSNLINLRHVHFGTYAKVPAGVLGRLTNLRSLPFVKIAKETGPQIGELGGLNYLRDTLSIYNLEHVRDGEEAAKAKLTDKKQLNKLVLIWGLSRPSNSGDNDEDVLEFLRPHSNLKYLEIHEFMGVKFPSWLSMSNNLKEIHLQGCSNCEEVPALGSLPNLVRVTLSGMQNLRCLGYEFYGYDPVSDNRKVLFPALKTLEIREARNLIEWREVPKERAEVFPCLEVLTLWHCEQLTSAPSHFPFLKRLDIFGMNSGGTPIASILSNSLTTLTSLLIKNVRGLACLPERLSQNNQNLSYLYIDNCPELACIAPPESHCCTSLQQLIISQCPKLSCLPDFGPSLEELWISDCFSLESIPIPEKGGLPSLRRLVIIKCPLISSLPDGLQYCSSLQRLEINNCPQICSLPDGIQYCTSLRQLEIQSCPKIKSIPIPSEGLPSLQQFEIRECPELSSLPDGIQYCTFLQQLEIQSCPKMKSIPIPSVGLPSLARLVLRQCDELSSLPSELGCCTSLAELTIEQCPKVTFVPIGRLSTSLQKLTVSDVESLPNLHGGFTSLRRLEIRKCQSTEIDLQILASLQGLTISDCPNLERVPSLHKLTSLRELRIWDCSRLTCLPSGLAMASPHVFTRLKTLRLGPFCNELDSFPAFQVLPQLEELSIYGWPKVKSLPEQIQHLTALTSLRIGSFEGVEAIPEWLGNLASLQGLVIWKCENLMYLPSVQAMHRLTKLKYLGIDSCPLLKERCREESGPEWPKISHIPEIYRACTFQYRRSINNAGFEKLGKGGLMMLLCC